MKAFLIGSALLGGAILLGASGITGTANGRAAGAPAATAPVPVVIELFTSEGCSSCPPADQLLIDLLRTQPVAGALVIGLSEHVDYWNHLGWKDPFSAALFSERQHGYADAAGTAEVYTPQMVVDGGATFVGSDRVAALEAITHAAKTPKASVSLAWTSSSPRTLTVTLPASAPASGATMFLAVIENGLTSSVRAGENSGHVLTHSAVTRRLVEVGRADRMGAFTRADVRVDLDAAWHVAATRVVVFGQAKGTRHVVAVGTIEVR